MPQSLSNVIIHLVFSTKNRNPWITPALQGRFHAYLATLARDQDCQAYRVGGVEDHVHLAIRLARTLSQADLVQSLKTKSAKWIKKQDPTCHDFQWQLGYGCFSISASHLDQLIAYIDRQEEYHRNRTFQDEFRLLCQRYRVTFDERYCWD